MEEVTIKKRGRPKGSTKKTTKIKEKFKASEKKKKPKKKAPSKTKDELLDEIENVFDDGEKDLELLSSEELDDEAKRAMIRARNAQAKKQERLNAVAQSSLVEKEMAVAKMVNVCKNFVDQLNNMPDKLTPQLHKRTKSEIRQKMVKEFDDLKKIFIGFIEEGL